MRNIDKFGEGFLWGICTAAVILGLAVVLIHELPSVTAQEVGVSAEVRWNNDNIHTSVHPAPLHTRP